MVSVWAVDMLLSMSPLIIHLLMLPKSDEDSA